MSATATAGSKRSPGSWRAVWPPRPLGAAGLRWPGRRAALVVIVMAAVGLGSPGVSAVRAAGASDAVRAQAAEAAAIKAEANRLALQYRGNPHGLRKAGHAALVAGRNDATVAAFNRAVRPGSFDHAVLDDCRTEGLSPNKSHWAQPIDTPPFWGYPLRPGITFTYLGLKVDADARVMMMNGRPAANVFAAGEIMAGNILGKGYVAGVGMTIGTVFGQIAGREAARHAVR